MVINITPFLPRTLIRIESEKFRACWGITYSQKQSLRPNVTQLARVRTFSCASRRTQGPHSSIEWKKRKRKESR